MKKRLNTEIEKIAYNCRQATLLIEKKQEVELTNREKLELKIHLAGCYICRVYEEQSVLINSMMRTLFKGTSTDGIKLDDSYKQKLKKQIEDELDKK
ncbi:hypothetical protein D0C36_00260 [Mucilaginibacter conchicola]|uniref:Zf-HC2 domain-containing protein n=1 Tax=Mucilaginibacter conchicola TaxID=2303333 RepID=A0A372NVJ4_9SPHI|nr:hypothetical protein [Mucilaginibacter conchicola]RFZ94032.1 hypothetical protein D0C36_00260 [Mucilaginibacter conchicola]